MTRSTQHHTFLPITVAAALMSTAHAQLAFDTAAVVPTGARAGGQVLADFDGDGDRDLAVTTSGLGNQDLVELFRNVGGTFTPAGTLVLANGSGPTGLAVLDIDNDGDLDLVVTLKNFNAAQVLTNVGPFSFNASATVSTGGAEPRQITAADMDGDGAGDIVISNRSSSNISVLRNTGGALTLLGVFAAGDETRDHAVGDFDGDGDLDVAVASHDSRQVGFLTNLGGGALGAPSFLPVPAGARPDGLAAADFDGDGDLDVLAGTGDDNNLAQNFVALYRNTGGTFGGPIAFATGGLDTGDVFAADLDGDGDVDVVTANQASGNLSLLANTGGALGAATLVAIGVEPSEVIGADVDGNGTIDLAVTLRQQANVYVLDNQAAVLATNYCAANPNSTGVAARMSATGSNVVAANDLRLGASQLPLNTVGFFLTSQTAGFAPNPGGSAGNLCLTGNIGRYSLQIQNSGATGTMGLQLDLTSLPTPTGNVAAVAGETWRFQCWFRDSIGGSATSNFTDGLSVTFQ
ncbi:MAG: VCBS repeat-containing protein [Planctomycetota bacterium]